MPSPLLKNKTTPRVVRTLKLIAVILLSTILSSCSEPSKKTIKIGILHSLTGAMAISEKPIIDATKLAIDEINAAGGLLGSQLQAIILDGKSQPNVSAEMAERLITKEQVSTIFGCWTSVCRKAVKVVVERHDHLLFYPAQYEGLEHSENIIYTGSTLNQQITPAVTWAQKKMGNRFYLAASDYIFPRAANNQVKHQLAAIGAELTGEHYLPLGSKKVDVMVSEIMRLQPDVILNTINGDSNHAFLHALYRHKNTVPIISFNLGEAEKQQIGNNLLADHYAASSYFQSLPSAINQKFIRAFKATFGEKRSINAVMETAYLSVHLWAKAANQAGTDNASAIRQAIKGIRLRAPEGNITVSATNNHLWKPLYIGIAQPDGQFKIIWSEQKPIRPLPFPSYRSRVAWKDYLNSLHQQWGGHWFAPINNKDQVPEK